MGYFCFSLCSRRAENWLVAFHGENFFFFHKLSYLASSTASDTFFEAASREELGTDVINAIDARSSLPSSRLSLPRIDVFSKQANLELWGRGERLCLVPAALLMEEEEGKL